MQAYRTDLDQFARFYHPRLQSDEASLGNVQEELVAQFPADLEERGMRPSTVARKLAALRALFRFLIRLGILNRNPASGARASERPTRQRRTLTPEQVRAALDAASEANTFTATRDRAIAEVVYGGGLRLSELVDLNLTSLRLDDGIVQIPSTGGPSRQVPIGTRAVEALRSYLIRRADQLIDQDMSQVEAGALFLNRRGRRLHRRSFQRIASQCIGSDAAAESGGRRASGARLLRTSFAAHLLEAGADATSVGRLLGQSALSASTSSGMRDIDELRRKYDSAHPRAGRDAKA